MLKPVIILGAAGMLAVTALGLPFLGKSSNPLTLLRHLPEVDAAFSEDFQAKFLSDTNQLRNKFGVETLSPDTDIQTLIGLILEDDHAPESIELNSVFDALQKKFPGAQYLAANLVSSSSTEELMEQLSRWEELGHPEFQELSTAVVKSGRRLVAMSVLSRRIPKFTIDGANHGGGRFFNQCPHCHSTHALDLDRKNKTLVLSCPDCERAYDVLAADSKGVMRRANDFFTGFQVPGGALPEPEVGHIEHILSIWKQVASRCDYEYDHAEFNESEVWKTSDDTWLEREGDCEDTSILLVDSLISAGYPARVAIGWNGNIGQHAWVVVKVEEQQYVIESTIQENPTIDDLVLASEAAPFYRPEQLFDRESLYFQNAKPDEVSVDYFSDSTWTQVSWKDRS